MKSILLDTNVMLRLTVPELQGHDAAVACLNALVSRQIEITVADQSFREFWHVATRSRQSNGLALHAPEVTDILEGLRQRVRVLYGSERSLSLWLNLLSARRISGARCHDANLAALALTNGVDTSSRSTWLTSALSRFRS